MKKIIFIICLAILFTGCTAQEQRAGGGIMNSFSGNLTNSATTTTSTSQPVMVLDTNPERRYAYIQNDSDTVIYLWLRQFDSGLAASTTVTLNDGIRLNANGGSFEIDGDGLYTGQVWATSSAADKNIIYIEK